MVHAFTLFAILPYLFMITGASPAARDCPTGKVRIKTTTFTAFKGVDGGFLGRDKETVIDVDCRDKEFNIFQYPKDGSAKYTVNPPNGHCLIRSNPNWGNNIPLLEIDLYPDGHGGDQPMVTTEANNLDALNLKVLNCGGGNLPQQVQGPDGKWVDVP